MKNTLDEQYTNLLKLIIEKGVVKEDRTGVGTKSVFGIGIRHNMKQGFPLLTTKKVAFSTMVVELLWFLRGDTNIQWLVKNGCNIWNGDAYKNFEKQCIPGTGKKMTKEEFVYFIKNDYEFAKKWGDLGPIYGAQWRNWFNPECCVENVNPDGTTCGEFSSTHIDQIKNLINDLKNNPDSRRLMVSAWNVGEIDQMTLPPCHYGFQCYTRELTDNEILDNLVKSDPKLTDEISQILYDNMTLKAIDVIKDKKLKVPTLGLSLMWNQRSVDTFLGLPFNLASYGLLLEILAKEVNMVPDELIACLGDTHLYLNHMEQAVEQIGRDLDKDDIFEILKDDNELLYWEYVAINKLKLEAIGNVDYEQAARYRNAERQILKGFPRFPLRTREPYPLPTLKFKSHLDDFDSIIDILRVKDFVLLDYQCHSTIKAPLNN